MEPFKRWRQQAKQLRLEVYALYLAYRDPRVPWHAKAFIACVVGYALSPIDLIPDPIPILGYLDDLVLLPLGIWLATRMIPASTLQDCRARAASANLQLPGNWWAATVIILLWLAALMMIARFVIEKLSINAPPDARMGY